MQIPLIKEFTYNLPIKNVWQALTDTDKMRKWYFPQLQKFEPIVGYKIQFDDTDSEYQKEWIVTKVEKGKTFAHSWAYKGYSGSSEVIVDLFEKGNETRLSVTQIGLESFPNHPHFKRERFERGWDNLLGQNLKHLLESSSK
ncbi:SRPBCC domain-containing protein [Spirosoma sp. HMF3257]|uniref:SRPBCC domain-containing protein n=1 Tax=Spirosoma telluris TaxID=2183553 RepID=A0A327NFG6_9BACT|nr:SRPBCC domain-containing protein [Spirosoma telluris]RAI74070.1 SRPBCC domain-containing protein [Spirosoma telluris]